MSVPVRDVVVVGAGAAGLVAAIFAAREGADTLLLDSAAKLGAKILISGGGRCNVTNDTVTPDDFNATNRNLLAKVLRSFGVADAIAFFRGIGVELKREETGKLFPVTDRARTVLDALLGEVERVGATIRTESRVDRIEPQHPGGFLVHASSGAVAGRRVILATGGRSVPKTGSDGHGYSIAVSLGHTTLPTFPALVPLVVDGDHWMKALKGISAAVELALSARGGRVVRRMRGPMLFTHFGVSGPAVLDMSRHWIALRDAGEEPRLAVSFLPGESFDDVDAWIRGSAVAKPHASLTSALRPRLAERLADAILASGAQVDPATPLGRLTKAARRAVVHALLTPPLPVSGDRGFAFAEVTAGGVPLTEVDVRTMESARQAGLYLCGEILDVDGRIGGFNFHWAWASGRLAGLSAARDG